MNDQENEALRQRISELEKALDRVSDKWKQDCDALNARMERMRLAGNAMSYELQDTDPDVKFDSIKTWKQSLRP